MLLSTFGFGAMLGLFIGCDEPAKTVSKAPSCNLKLENLGAGEGSEWLFLEALPGKTPVPQVKTRLKFYKKDNKTHAKYTMGTLSDVYDYQCTLETDTLVCREKVDVVKLCQALLVGGKKCTFNSMTNFDKTLLREDIEKGAKKAKGIYKQIKKTPDWNQYQLTHNNLANRLQRIVYTRIDAANCRLNITDNYVTVYNGERTEDSNPVGVNAFVANDQGTLFWEDCTEVKDLVDTKSGDYPEDPANVQPTRRHMVGEEIHYWLLHEPLRVPEDKCEYSYDLWLDGKPTDKKGLKPELTENKKELRWHFSHNFSQTSKQPHVFVMDITKTCEGKEAEEIRACNAVFAE